jgi:hypothetical protein
MVDHRERKNSFLPAQRNTLETKFLQPYSKEKENDKSESATRCEQREMIFHKTPLV